MEAIGKGYVFGDGPDWSLLGCCPGLQSVVLPVSCCPDRLDCKGAAADSRGSRGFTLRNRANMMRKLAAALVQSLALVGRATTGKSGCACYGNEVEVEREWRQPPP